LAKIGVMPAREIIDGFAGAIDFYDWKGIHCVRMWPYWKPREATIPERHAQEAFGYVNKMAGSLPPYVVEQYRKMAASSRCSWKDIFVRGYLYGSRHR